MSTIDDLVLDTAVPESLALLGVNGSHRAELVHAAEAEAFQALRDAAHRTGVEVVHEVPSVVQAVVNGLYESVESSLVPALDVRITSVGASAEPAGEAGPRARVVVVAELLAPASYTSGANPLLSLNTGDLAVSLASQAQV